MTGTVITTDFAVSHPERTITVIRIILIRGGILPDIFQCRYDLEGGSGRIKSLGGAVQQYCTGIIVDQIIPDLRNGIRIKIGMRHHCQNLAGRHFRYNDGTTVNIQLVIGHLLDMDIQCGIYIISGILFPGSIVFHFIAQGGIGVDQIVIGQSLHSHASLGGITYDMRKQILIRIVSSLLFIRIQYRLCQNIPIPGINGSAVIAGQQNLLTGIITVVDHILFAGCHKMTQIDQQAQEQDTDASGRKPDFPLVAHTFSVPGVLFAVGIFFLCIFLRILRLIFCHLCALLPSAGEYRFPV